MSPLLLPMKIKLFSWLYFLLLCSDFFGIHVALVPGECLSDGSTCLEDQMSFLLKLKNTLKFNVAASSKLVSWNSSADCCSWGGVTWDDSGHVVALDLSSEFISGGFHNSSSIFSLQSLRSLSLANNTFYSSQIPSGFDRLANLTYLNLSDAGFFGQIPMEISRLTKLVIIDFSMLYFPGVPMLKLENPNLRMLIQNLSELRELYLDGVDISAQGKGWCQALSSSVPHLQVLSLQSCYLSGHIDSSLLKLWSLSSIRLDNNNFNTPVPEFLANFSNLTQLGLRSCGLYGKCPEKIFQVPTLQILDLSNNMLLEGSLPEFPHNRSLGTLVLSDTNFSGKVPNSIGNLKRLSRIELANCDFSGAIPNSMADLTQLVYLDFSNNNFSGVIPPLSLSKGLTGIYLSHNSLAGPISSLHWDGLVNLVVLDLRNNSLNGSLPTDLFSLSSLQKIQLSTNRFSGPLSEFLVAPSSVLDTLDLSSNNLEGPLPESIFDLHHLNILDLSSNRFNGTVELSSFQKIGNLTALSLSYNNLSINAVAADPALPLLPNLTALNLASCKLRALPDLSTQSRLAYLDLSDNQIPGNIPNWIWSIGDGYLNHLNLSHNLFEGLQQPLSNLPPFISTLDLHSNMLRGQIPTPPLYSSYVDYSNNRFICSIPDDIGTYIRYTVFFSASNNNINGIIPESICTAINLRVLDFSENAFSSKIPSCLFQNENLAVLSLGRNKFIGNIPGELGRICSLQTLDLNGNRLVGRIPRSLANCKALEVLNLGNNQMSDSFPCWLKKITSLRVLVLRGNKFHGRIGCPMSNSNWEMLQIMDLAHNNFSGKLPEEWFSTWTAMMTGEIEVQPKLKHLQYQILQFSQLYYQDIVTVTIKGQESELVKVLTIFTSIDLSCNNFQGEIPDMIGKFTSLYFLNLSHNVFTGQIPSSIGNLRQLESLDLSQNRLSGEIPAQLAKLNFLSVLNLSFNLLLGRIPKGNQMQTFSKNSFVGNRGLCGFPLDSCGDDTPPTSDIGRQSGSNRKEIKWEYIASEIGFVTGLGMVIWPLVLSRRWRRCYYKHVDRILLSRILNQQNQGRVNGGRRSLRIGRQRL